MAKTRVKVVTIPVVPNPKRGKTSRGSDPRYLAGQKLLVSAMHYLAKSNKKKNSEAIAFLSEHFRTQFRMTDRP